MANFVKWLLDKNRKEVYSLKRLIFSDGNDGSNIWIVKHLGLLMIVINAWVFVFLAAVSVILLPLFALMIVINAPYSLYLWIKDLPYFKRKYIKESLKRFENELNKMPAYDFRITPTKILVHVPNSYDEFMKQFFVNYSRNYCTYNVSNDKMVCDRFRRRSIQDIYLISKTYFPSITLDDVIQELILLVKTEYLGVSKCSDIHMYVFKKKDDYTGVYTDKELEFMSGVNFKQLMKYYEQNSR